jgi:hypothetical protein
LPTTNTSIATPDVSTVRPNRSFQQLDNDIRKLLQFYRIDDGDLVEVTDGSQKRLLLVHPERALPPYIQQDQSLLRRLQGLYHEIM